MTTKKTLPEWLRYLEQLHPKAIDMGLARIRPVFERLKIAPQVPITFTVTGTNGKGSVCAMLESILRTEGYRVGLYTSPHISDFNERIKINGVLADDAALVAAFEIVEAARGEISLTYFEFTTLAAFLLFADAKLDAWILEVGLGGRLDATNLIDADCAILTSVGIDHTDYVGDTREKIAREKLGIARHGKILVVGDSALPETAHRFIADDIKPAQYLRRNFEFKSVADGAAQWLYTAPDGARQALPYPALRGQFQIQNAATALAALHALRPRLPVRAGAVREGLVTVTWPGRFQVLPGRPTIVLDAAHNPHAAEVLSEALGGMGFHPETFAVFGMLADKDIAAVIAAVRDRITVWHVVATHGPRALSSARVRQALRAGGVADRLIRDFDGVEAALAAAQQAAQEVDRIVVFGSFHILSDAMAALKTTKESA